jgi:hypothetical protein
MSPTQWAFLPRSTESLKGAWLPIRLTAVFLLLNEAHVWYVLALMITLASLGLIFHSLLRTPAFWVGVTLLFVTWIWRLWPLVDNHQYLAGYWSLSILIALWLPDPPASLAVSARWLLALVFLWAALWKGVLSPDYRDGRFFTAQLMIDPRFEEQTHLLSGLSLDDIRGNRDYLTPPAEGEEVEAPRQEALKTTPRFRFWVAVITWSVLAYEAALGLAFLLPWGRWTPLLRNAGLIAFCIGTFAFAPVRNFGWLLLILGLAQVDAQDTRWRILLLIAWFLIAFVSTAPWAHLRGLLT